MVRVRAFAHLYESINTFIGILEVIYVTHTRCHHITDTHSNSWIPATYKATEINMSLIIFLPSPTIIYATIIMTFVMPPVPAALMGLPFGLYGISFDISTRQTEDDLPNGWHSRRVLANTYKRLGDILDAAGFVRHHYNEYRRPASHPIEVWILMVQLGEIRLPGLLRLKTEMRFIQDFNDIAAGLLDVPGAGFVLTRPSVVADDPNNNNSSV